MLSDTEHLLPKSACVECEHPFDRAAGVDGDGPPEPGDVTLCIECGSLNIFDDDLTMRRPTVDEYVEANKNALIQKVRTAILTVSRKGKAAP